MDEAKIERLERLQRLRESGALSDAEFQSEKRKLLSAEIAEGRTPRRWLPYAGSAIVLVTAAVGLSLWMLGSTKPQQPITSSNSQPATNSVAQVSELPAKSPAERLADAFEAATGRRSAFTQTEAGEIIVTKPIRIVELPFGPALLTRREIKDGCHACTGAIGVFYLKEQGGTTSVIGRWPKAVEGWGWGAPPTEWYLTDKFTAYPAIFASGGFMGQGVVMESATITELRPNGPISSDVIGTGFSDEGAIADNERAACILKGRIANIRKDRSFDVIARGSVNTVDHYIKKNGKFVAAAKIDWGIPCEI